MNPGMQATHLPVSSSHFLQLSPKLTPSDTMQHAPARHLPEAQSWVAFASVHLPARYAPLAGVGAGVGKGVGKVVGAGVGYAVCASHETAQP